MVNLADQLITKARDLLQPHLSQIAEMEERLGVVEGRSISVGQSPLSLVISRSSTPPAAGASPAAASPAGDSPVPVGVASNAAAGADVYRPSPLSRAG